MRLLVAALLVALAQPAGAAFPTEVPASVHSAEPRAFARVPGGLGLGIPADDVVMFAYHESLFGTAMAMRPRGRAVLVDHPAFRKPKRTHGPRYLVMASRGRGTGPTTALDIVLNRRTNVVAPVTGRVVDVTVYRLYCSRVDKRIIIRPFGHPRRRVVLFHLQQVRVERGDEVTAGETPLGIPRVFRGAQTQYDAYLPGAKPHIHIEVERRPTKPLPGCRA